MSREKKLLYIVHVIICSSLLQAIFIDNIVIYHIIGVETVSMWVHAITPMAVRYWASGYIDPMVHFQYIFVDLPIWHFSVHREDLPNVMNSQIWHQAKCMLQRSFHTRGSPNRTKGKRYAQCFILLIVAHVVCACNLTMGNLNSSTDWQRDWAAQNSPP